MSNAKVQPEGEGVQGEGGRPFRSQVSSAIASNSHLLAKAELYFTAFLSMSDMVSDLVMVARYYRNNEISFALASLICLGLNLTIQSAGVFLTKPLDKQLKEQAIVWTLIKPGVDAHRVATKAQTQEGDAISTRADMTVARVIEMVTESIPGTIIQAMAIVATGDLSVTPVVSLTSSILTSAFISAQLSHEWDASQENQQLEPAFYGYLPSSLKWRGFTLLQLFLIASLNLVIRALSFVILSQRSISMVMMVFGGELALYLVVKILRGDFQYWAPIYGPPGVFISFMVRLLIKLCVDWTGCAQFRHQQEVGGLYWSFTLLLTCMIGIVAAPSHGDRTLNIIMGICCAVLLVTYALFLASIERKYVATFFDTRTASEYNASCFLNATSDEMKFETLKVNENLWRDIRNDVKDWLTSRLPIWLEEEPSWLTDYHRSLIPAWAVDDKALLSRIRNKNVETILENRRRSSVANIIGALPNAQTK
eukprot:CAMPEP_0197549932 /NCGR_PEP_ID=MMETSP1320-20131121/3695_1 /TAXON_ID=91990 /ORGANISM="Bolidomonas sp., Strain RCC2347" /LENGTH=479 /DNA_ID=CAMNT_0043110229 /DNA_START=103 /DNA_END=1542 /DNA_ORIENTATION=+